MSIDNSIILGLPPDLAARLIIRQDREPIARHKFWYKRRMALRPSNPNIEADKYQHRFGLRGAQGKPFNDLAFHDKAQDEHYWSNYRQTTLEAMPFLTLKIGPLCATGRFESQADRVDNPLPLERERAPWGGIYSRAEFEADMAYFESARDLLRENFYLGQVGDGPRIDGLAFLRVDNLILAEQDHCKARLRATWAILEQRRLAKAAARPKLAPKWEPIGEDEKVALAFKHRGNEVRKVGRGYELRVK